MLEWSVSLDVQQLELVAELGVGVAVGHEGHQPQPAPQREGPHCCVELGQDRGLADPPLEGTPPLVGALDESLLVVAEGVVDAHELPLEGEVEGVAEPQHGQLARLHTVIINMELSNEQLAQELLRLRGEHARKQAQIDSVIAGDPELQAMRRKIDASYLSKQRAQQMTHKQARTLHERTLEAQQEAEMLKAAEEERRRREEAERRLAAEEWENLRVLREQVQRRQELEGEARREYEKEREGVNREVARLVREDQGKLEAAQERKKELYEAMQEQFVVKQRARALEVRRDQEELERIAQYQAGLDQRGRRQKEEMARREQEKAAIHQRMRLAEEQRKREVEELEKLRLDYYQFVGEEQQQRRDQEEERKKGEFRRMLQEAEREQRQLREQQRQEEARLEGHFRAKMLERLAEQDRLDQLARERRRVKEQEHRREVERLWQVKLDQYRQAKAQEQQEVEKQRVAELWRIQIVEQEKERLIREHAGNLEGFLHPGLVERARKAAAHSAAPGR